MRHVPLLLASVFFSGPIWADEDAESSDRCLIEAKANDRVAKGEDVVVRAGERVEDAIAIEGNVTIRRGARVNSAIALHGSVKVEAGARVTGSVLAIGGKANVSPDAKVEGSQLSLDDDLQIVGETGRKIRINASVDGESLVQEILKPVLEKFRECGVISLK